MLKGHGKNPRVGTGLALAVLLSACGHAPRKAPPARASVPPTVTERTTEIEPKESDDHAPYRAILRGGADLYLPPWFAPKASGYDLIVHFHGEGRWQAANVERVHLNVAVVSVTVGVGTKAYADAFRSPDAFDRLLADVDAEIAKSGRANGSRLDRLALSAWSAGFSSIAAVLDPTTAARVDAILLADGFFASFTDVKRRTLNARSLEKFARFAEAARRDEKLLGITHTTIPTGPYPSTQECVGKLLEMIEQPKTPVATVGPRGMHAIYTVDEGSLHVRGFEGTQASDHVKQLQAMGETLYPLLKERWDRPAERPRGGLRMDPGSLTTRADARSSSGNHAESGAARAR